MPEMKPYHPPLPDEPRMDDMPPTPEGEIPEQEPTPEAEPEPTPEQTAEAAAAAAPEDPELTAKKEGKSTPPPPPAPIAQRYHPAINEEEKDEEEEDVRAGANEKLWGRVWRILSKPFRSGWKRLLKLLHIVKPKTPKPRPPANTPGHSSHILAFIHFCFSPTFTDKFHSFCK